MPSLLFHRLYLPQPVQISPLGDECCAEKRLDQLARQRLADDLRAEAEDVHVVVLDALMGRIRIVADRRPDPVDLARGDRRPDARAADEDAALRLPAPDRLADRARAIRV